ncbi:MAG: heme exporter protein CcmB [bacterium]
MSLAALLWKDARRELRSKETLQAGLVLVLLFFVLDVLSFPDLSDQPRTAAAVLWIPILYGAAAVAGRGFAAEADRGTLDLLRASPAALSSHGWSRTILHLAVLAVLAGFALAVGTFLFALPAIAAVSMILGLACVGLAVVATLAAGLAAQARARDILLPILVVPVSVPLLQSGLAATTAALRGDPWSLWSNSVLLMAGYDVLAIGFAWFLWPIVLEGD